MSGCSLFIVFVTETTKLSVSRQQEIRGCSLDQVGPTRIVHSAILQGAQQGVHFFSRAQPAQYSFSARFAKIRLH
jgi:hypothetical protein